MCVKQGVYNALYFNERRLNPIRLELQYKRASRYSAALREQQSEGDRRGFIGRESMTSYVKSISHLSSSDNLFRIFPADETRSLCSHTQPQVSSNILPQYFMPPTSAVSFTYTRLYSSVLPIFT